MTTPRMDRFQAVRRILTGFILAASELCTDVARAALITHEVNITLNASASQSYQLDVDQNGTTDFTFSATYVVVPTVGVVGFDVVDVPAGLNNGVVIDSASGDTFPTVSLLTNGESVSAADLFSNGSADQGNLFFTFPTTGSSGNFLGTTGFVGLKFEIAGQTHYGFAEVTVNSLTAPNNPLGLTIGLVGYNDVANLPVTISRPSVVPEPGSIVLFGFGFVALAFHARRKRGSTRRASRGSSIARLASQPAASGLKS
jgi:hypothetical protein